MASVKTRLISLAILIALGAWIAVSAAPAGPVTAPTGTTAAQPGMPAQARQLQPGAQATALPGAAGQPQATGPADIHDIRHPVQVGVNPMIYYGTAAGVGALAAGALAWFLIRRRMQRKRGDVTEVTAAIYRSPEEEALENLKALESSLPGDPVVFYFGLSALFRHYLQRRFDINAPEMTTEELLPRLSALEFQKEIQAGLKSFLKFGDQVKFARTMPGRQDMTAHLALVRDLVNKFAPAEAESGPGEVS